MNTLKPRAYLIDSSIYIFRAWFTMPDTLTDRDGNPVNALYGFADFLLNLLEREKPTHIACAFDASLETSYRNEIYPLYKANREPAPPELKCQFQYCRDLVRAAGIAEGVTAQEIKLDKNRNVMAATPVPVEEPKAEPAAADKKEEQPFLYSPEGIKQVMDKARDVQKQMNERSAAQQEALGDL